MKIRLDFVTNSSSSSFICALCGNAEEVHEYAESLWLYCPKCKSQFEDKCAGINWPAEVLDPVIRKTLDYCISLQEKSIDKLNKNNRYYKDALREINESISYYAEMIEWLDNPGGDNQKILDRIMTEINVSHSGGELPVADYCPLCSSRRVPMEAVIAHLIKESGKTMKELEEDVIIKYGTIHEIKEALNIQ